MLKQVPKKTDLAQWTEYSPIASEVVSSTPAYLFVLCISVFKWLFTIKAFLTFACKFIRYLESITQTR
jgi:hypothetical protein